MIRTVATTILLILTISFHSKAIDLNIRVFLEGPFFNDHMVVDLNTGDHIPLNQPYNTSPWNYTGNESVSTMPANVVDWILVDILKKSSDTSQNNFELFERRAGLLLSSGTITDTDGSSYLSFTVNSLPEFYVKVHHRNHLPVISSLPVASSGAAYSWDFTTGKTQAIGGAGVQKQMSAGIWSMIAADGNASNQIDNRDKNSVWLQDAGNIGYLSGDYDMNGHADFNDILNKWALNVGLGSSQNRGILKVCDENGRYFCNGGKAVYLTGSHTWDNLQDIGDVDFNYDDYLDWMLTLKHNFIRLWAWESPYGTDWAKTTDNAISPIPYLLSGTKYDITQLNEAYFDRLRQRIQLAQERGIYVGVMLFEGFSAEHTYVAWSNHPFKAGNNINGVAADRFLVHTNVDPAVVQAQELYVREVIDIVNYYNLNNVLYEIGNEIPYTVASDEWQNDMIDFIHDYEFNTYGVNRPVGKTCQNNGGNETLFNSPADWISPHLDGGFDCLEGDAPIATGDKVIISDTDHFYYLWYNNYGNPVDFVWKSFTGGINAIHMDNWGGGDNLPGRLHGNEVAGIYNLVRYNMGWATELANRMDLISTSPQPGLSSTGFCLASDTEFVVYLPQNTSSVVVDLTGVTGQFEVEWLDTYTGNKQSASNVTAGNPLTFNSPFTQYSILYLKKND